MCVLLENAWLDTMIHKLGTTRMRFHETFQQNGMLNQRASCMCSAKKGVIAEAGEIRYSATHHL